MAVEIQHDDRLNEEDGVFIQVALLYTSCSGQRRVRILNLALKCCSQMAELFRHCELDTLINYWSKAGKIFLYFSGYKGASKEIRHFGSTGSLSCSWYAFTFFLNLQ